MKIKFLNITTMSRGHVSSQR